MTTHSAETPIAAAHFERIDFFGLPLDLVSTAEVVEAVDALMEEGREIEHGSLAANNVVRARDDPGYAAALWRHRLVTADGQAVVWAARLLGYRVPERVAGADLMLALIARAAVRGHRVYLLGAAPDVLTEAESALKREYPRLNIVGRHHGYFAQDDELRIVADIAQSEADLLFLALPSPWKEAFVVKHRRALEVPFAMGVGGMFDVIAGKVRRAPRWIQRIGLEWAFRMVQEPRRLLRRYITTNTRFVLLVSTALLKERMPNLRRPRS